MPVEDVEFLKSNGVKQSYVFMIDSKDRDKLVCKSPAEYVVNFDTPFRNVVGMDIVDGSIPRTMYNIDVNNNSISFLIHDDAYDLTTLQEGAFTTVTVEPGDYTIQTLIPALNNVLSMPLNGGGGGGETIAITAEPVSNPPDVKNLIQFRCPYPFIFNMLSTSSTIAEALGFDEFPQLDEALKPLLEQRYECLNVPVSDNASRILKGSATPLDIERELILSKSKTQGEAQAVAAAAALEAARVGPIGINKQMFHSVDLSPSVSLGATRTVFEGPRGVILSHNGAIAQSFAITSKGYLSKINVAFGPSTTVAVATWRILYGTDLATAVQVGTGTMAVSSVDGSLSDSADLNILLSVVGTYWLEVFSSSVDVGAIVSVFYNDVLAPATAMLVATSSSSPFTSIDREGIFYNMSASVLLRDSYHLIVAPGIYNLVGERYITLRCPEIEEASFRSLSYTKHNIGLAKFRLGVVGFSENRFDFSTVPSREFHPIGKLTKLTLRFERSNGELYDFKGVNNTLTVAINYYEPKQMGTFKPVLNPNYVGDFSAYRRTEEDQEGDSDDLEDEEEEGEYTRDTNFDFAWRKAELDCLPEDES
jgi:hypothetical protein